LYYGWKQCPFEAKYGLLLVEFAQPPAASIWWLIVKVSTANTPTIPTIAIKANINTVVLVFMFYNKI
jgi:hypothetical protein